MNTDFFNDPVALATLVLACVTVVLAIGTFLTIRQNRIFREKDLKERLLNEIIEWAIDIIKLRSDNFYKELVQFSVTNDKNKLLQFFKAEIMEFKGTLSPLVIQGHYINIISFSFGKGIQGSIKPLSTEIDKLVNYLDDWLKAFSNQIEYQNNELDIVSVAGQADEISTRIDAFAKNLLDEVAKIKAKINNNPYI